MRLFAASLRARHNVAGLQHYLCRASGSRPVCREIYTKSDIFRLLQLHRFDEEEMKRSFELIQATQKPNSETNSNSNNSSSITSSNNSSTNSSSNASGLVNVSEGLQALHRSRLGPEGTDSDRRAQHFLLLLQREGVQSAALSFPQYVQQMQGLAQRLDKQVYALGGLFLLTGLSVGVVLPCMPQLVAQLQLSPADFGLVVASFSFAKLLANFPAAHFVERFGRKLAISSGLFLCGGGIACLSLCLLPSFSSLSLPWLLLCRGVSGAGVALFMGGGYLSLADLSTPLNRSRSLAPVMGAFHAGSALGPALGGALVGGVGLGGTYPMVGSMFFLISLLNYSLLKETKSPLPPLSPLSPLPPLSPLTSAASPSLSSPSAPISPPSPPLSSSLPSTTLSPPSLSPAPAAALSPLSLLRSSPLLRETVLINSLFFFAWGGAQFTLLPLYLSPLSPQEMGGVFALSSLLNFCFAPLVGYLGDKAPKPLSLLGGLGLLSLSVSSLPLLPPSPLPPFLTLLLPLSLGSTLLSSLPPALLSDALPEQDRAQALSLLRTGGDVGLLLGAGAAGALASYLGDLSPAFYCEGMVLGATCLYYGYRLRLSNNNSKRKKGV